MTTKLPDLPFAADNRDESRTHLFVAAALNCDTGSMPVRVRNMSSSGALVEAAVLPKTGARITLNRGRLAARGRIAWSNGRQAGISFDASIFVADWMSRKSADHQRQVDQMIDSIRQGLPRSGDASNDSDRGISGILAELTLLKADLTQLGNSLAGDMILVATHPEIQLLDISLQRIDRIISRLSAQ